VIWDAESPLDLGNSDHFYASNIYEADTDIIRYLKHFSCTRTKEKSRNFVLYCENDSWKSLPVYSFRTKELIASAQRSFNRNLEAIEISDRKEPSFGRGSSASHKRHIRSCYTMKRLRVFPSSTFTLRYVPIHVIASDGMYLSCFSTYRAACREKLYGWWKKSARSKLNRIALQDTR